MIERLHTEFLFHFVLAYWLFQMNILHIDMVY